VNFVDEKKNIEIDIMVLNSNIVPFSKNQNVSLKIEWSKHSYLYYRMYNSIGIPKRLSNLKQFFFFKFDELPIELKRFSKKILDKFYKEDKETAQFLFGKKTQQQKNLLSKSSKGKRKLQQMTEGQDQQDTMKVQKPQQINQQGNKKLKTHYTQKAKTQQVKNMQLQNRQQLVKNYALEDSDPKILFDKSVDLYEYVKKKEYTVIYPTSYQEKQSVTFTDPSSLTQIKRILNKLVKQGYIINHFKQFERGGMMYKNVKVDEIDFTL